jgi:glycosyltransferase involved in cell wall biosynthesis
MKPMKICYIVNQYPKVSHSFIRREILALESHGAQVLRVAMRGWKDALVDAQDQAERERTRYVLAAGPMRLGLAVVSTALRRPLRFVRALAQALAMTRHSERALWYHLVYMAEACVVARWLVADGAQHIHAHFGTNPAEVALLVSTLTGVPFSFTVHGPEEFDKPAAIGLPSKIRQASRVVAISSYGRSQLYRWATLAEWHKIRVVHCGLDLDSFDIQDISAPLPNTLVCIGRLCEQKGQLILLQALRRVIDRGVACRVVLAGDGEMRAQIEDAIRSLLLSDHVRITGWIDNAQVRAELLQARALVLPSFAEGLPVVIMEALALGRPAICTFVAGVPELVLAGENGWLVPAGDVAALADAICTCLNTGSEEILAMGMRGRSRALARHDIRESARLLLGIFGEVQ